MYKVLGVGCATMDTVIKCHSLPKEDGFALVDSEELMSGGSCANTLVLLAQLGVNAAQLAKIGDDKYGKIFAKELKEAGVDTSLLQIKQDGINHKTTIYVDPQGAKSIFANMGNSLMTLDESDFTPEILKLEDVDCFFTDLFPTKPSIAIAKLCQEKNIPVICHMQCTPNFMANVGVPREEIEELLSLSDIAVSGEEGYYQIGATKDLEKALIKIVEEYNLSQGAICTKGESGAIWYDGKKFLQSEAFTANIVDTTGAGDCFLAGLIYSFILEKQAKKTALNFAAACGTVKCTQYGPRVNTDLEKIKNFLKK